jgi:hypothetical protein
VENYNLVYQHGVDTTRDPDFNWITNRYVAGITALTCSPVKRMLVHTNQDWVYPESGFEDGYLFREMSNNGCEIWADSADDIHSIMAINEVTLDVDDSYVYQFAVVTSVAGGTGATLAEMPADITDLEETVSKAWKKAFGWCEPWWWLYGETVLDGGNGEIGFVATGTHEDGIGGGCCGCVFSAQINPDPSPGSINVVNNGDCTGYIEFTDVDTGDGTGELYTVTLTVEDDCASQSDEIQFQVEAIPQTCDCGAGDWGDVDNSGGAPKPRDVVVIQQLVFFQNEIREWPDGWNCPFELGDVDNSGGAPKPRDVVVIQQLVFFQNDIREPKPCP